MNTVGIRPIRWEDIESYRACVGAVVQERCFLAHLEPFTLEQTAAFIAHNREAGLPQIVAVLSEESDIPEQGTRQQGVGWCDLRRFEQPVYRHVAELGIGVLKGYRGRGVGGRLIRTVLAAAPAAGIERIELSAYAKNTRAMALYRKVGFQLEGTRRRAKKLDGGYDDVHTMGLLL